MLFILCLAISAQAGVHQYTGLSLTTDGWTDFTSITSEGYDNSRVIFVSSSEGNDGTGKVYGIDAITFDAHGMFQNANEVNAYKTLAEGYKQLRDGYPDIILLKRGDVWAEGFESWGKSGYSATKRMILSAYGSATSARPEILLLRGENNTTNNLSHTIIANITLTSPSEWTSALMIRVGGENLLVEGCLIPKGANSGMVIRGKDGVYLKNVVVRRCVVVDRYPAVNTGHTQGIYGALVENFLVEESVVDHNGWTDNPAEGTGATIHNHNTYFDVSIKNPVMRYNISTRASSSGFMPGGDSTVLANLSLRDPIGITTSRSEVGQDGYISNVRQNVILEGWDSKTSNVTRWGISMSNTALSTIEDNIIASVTPGSGPMGIATITGDRYGQAMNVRNVTIKDNIIHNWATLRLDDARIDPAVPQLENIKLIGNRIHDDIGTGPLVLMNPANSALITESSGNVYHSANVAPGSWFRYGSPYMDLATWNSTVGDTTSVTGETNPTGGYSIPDYLASIGETATLENFWAKIREQRRGSWDERYTAVPVINFVRGKFGRGPVSIQYSPPASRRLFRNARVGEVEP